MLFHTKNRVVDAIQFTGEDSVPAIQAWMHPQSPMYGGKLKALTITVRDRQNDVLYPSIAPNYTTKTLERGSWILRDNDGELAVMTDAEFTERFEALPPPVVLHTGRVPVDVPAEGSAPGDDVDPTGGVPGVPVIDDDGPAV